MPAARKPKPKPITAAQHRDLDILFKAFRADRLVSYEGLAPSSLARFKREGWVVPLRRKDGLFYHISPSGIAVLRSLS